MTDDGFVINGTKYTADDLTFREQRELREVVRELVGDEEAKVEDMALMDFMPALIYIIVRRDQPEFTLEQALDMKLTDVLPADEEKKNGTRPTARPARSGTRK